MRKIYPIINPKARPVGKYHIVKDSDKLWLVNYPPTPEAMEWASGFIECALLLMSNFLSTFVIDSPCRYIFKPSFKIFLLALTSLSCITPQELQVHSLSDSFNSLLITPQVQIFELG
jgi:hypothetical protein